SVVGGVPRKQRQANALHCWKIFLVVCLWVPRRRRNLGIQNISLEFTFSDWNSKRKLGIHFSSLGMEQVNQELGFPGLESKTAIRKSYFLSCNPTRKPGIHFSSLVFQNVN